MRRITSIFVLLSVLLAAPQVIFAQTGGSLTLRALQSELFPLISGHVDARGADGALIPDLHAADFTVMENGSPRPVERLRLNESGYRVVIAINPAEAFAIRDAQGNSRYDYVATAVRTWVEDFPAEEDNLYSLVSPQGVQSAFEDAAGWLAAFENFAPDFSVLSPNLGALSSALQMAGQVAEDEGTATAVWLITAAPSAEALNELEAFQEAASAQGTPLFVWLVDSKARFSSDGSVALQNLTPASGGQFFAFSGEEEMPNPAGYFETLGSVYIFQYNSEIRTSGSHEVSLVLETEEQVLSSQTKSFELSLLAPNPILISPPSQILRTPSDEDAQVLTPFSQVIEIIVEFPDHFERELLRTSLYVNGERVGENRVTPFNRFVWDLSEFNSSQRVILRVEAEDELGMMGSTIELPVEISVQAGTNGLQGALSRNLPVLTIVAALMAAGVLFLIFVLSGRFAPPAIFNRSDSGPELEANDPLLDAPPGLTDMARPASGRKKQSVEEERKTGTVSPSKGLELAFLEAISSEAEEQNRGLIPLESSDIRFGSDARQSSFVLEGDSVEGLHAALRRTADGGFELADLGSETGTWLNYAPVSQEGARLQHGDLIHIGRVAFRFYIEKPPGMSVGGTS